MTIYLLQGPPGSGKSTQSQLLAQNCNFQWVSVGQLVRQTDLPTSEEVRVNAGLMADNALVDRLVDTRLGELNQVHPDQPIVIDGYPRTIEQTRWFIDNYGHCIKAIISLSLSEVAIRRRLLKRQRLDDDPDAIERRLAIYNTNNPKILQIWAAKEFTVYTIDAQVSAAVLNQRIIKEIGYDQPTQDGS